MDASRPFADRERAREAGRKGGRARARKRLTLDRVEEEFGPLDTPDDAKRRLDVLGRWIASGLLAGAPGGAAVRSVEVWLRGYEAELDRDRLKAAEKRIAELESELARARRGNLGVSRG